MSVAYYDTNYLIKLQWPEAGSAEVQDHAASVTTLVCSFFGRAEFMSAAHRKVREGAATTSDLQLLAAQLRSDTTSGALGWVPITESQFGRVESVFLSAGKDTYLRAGDALHLACASELGLTEIFSNDRHLLAAAPLFGLRGVNVIP